MSSVDKKTGLRPPADFSVKRWSELGLLVKRLRSSVDPEIVSLRQALCDLSRWFLEQREESGKYCGECILGRPEVTGIKDGTWMLACRKCAITLKKKGWDFSR